MRRGRRGLRRAMTSPCRRRYGQRTRVREGKGAAGGAVGRTMVCGAQRAAQGNSNRSQPLGNSGRFRRFAVSWMWRGAAAQRSRGCERAWEGLGARARRLKEPARMGPSFEKRYLHASKAVKVGDLQPAAAPRLRRRQRPGSGSLRSGQVKPGL